jgi:hypothetical protein
MPSTIVMDVTRESLMESAKALRLATSVLDALMRSSFR